MLDERFLAHARALIAARSVTEEGNLPALEVLEPLGVDAGFTVQRLPAVDTPDRDANLLVGPLGGLKATGEPLLLVTHTDTVSPGPRSAWHTDPFELVIDGDRAYGLGTADVKLDALCKLEAMRRLRDVPLKRPVWFLGTYGEEAGLRGAKAFAASLPFRPRYVLCGEPSELQLHTAHKGYCLLVLSLRVRDPALVSSQTSRVEVIEGRAAHSSTPHLGDNAADRALETLLSSAQPVVAIEAGASTNTIPGRCEATVAAPGSGDAVDLLPALAATRRLVDEWRTRVERLRPSSDARFAPRQAVANLTRLRGRDGAVEVAVDARLLPAHDVEALVHDFVFDLDAVCGPQVEVSVVTRRYAAGMELPADAELSRIAAQVLTGLGLDATLRAKATSTEAGVFARLGLEVAVFGPSVSVGNAQCANEHASIEQVAKAIEVYERLILALCG